MVSEEFVGEVKATLSHLEDNINTISKKIDILCEKINDIYLWRERVIGGSIVISVVMSLAVSLITAVWRSK